MKNIQRKNEGASQKIDEHERRKNNPAGYALERINRLINSFQTGLAEDVEVGMSVVGSGAPFRLHSVRISNPDILIFDGIDENNNVVQLLQNYSQMAIMLVAVPKLEEKPFRMGFPTHAQNAQQPPSQKGE
jgi:hypothetical protein